MVAGVGEECIRSSTILSSSVNSGRFSLSRAQHFRTKSYTCCGHSTEGRQYPFLYQLASWKERERETLEAHVKACLSCKSTTFSYTNAHPSVSISWLRCIAIYTTQSSAQNLVCKENDREASSSKPSTSPTSSGTDSHSYMAVKGRK